MNGRDWSIVEYIPDFVFLSNRAQFLYQYRYTHNPLFSNEVHKDTSLTRVYTFFRAVRLLSTYFL